MFKLLVLEHLEEGRGSLIEAFNPVVVGWRKALEIRSSKGATPRPLGRVQNTASPVFHPSCRCCAVQVPRPSLQRSNCGLLLPVIPKINYAVLERSEVRRAPLDRRVIAQEAGHPVRARQRILVNGL